MQSTPFNGQLECIKKQVSERNVFARERERKASSSKFTSVGSVIDFHFMPH